MTVPFSEKTGRQPKLPPNGVLPSNMWQEVTISLYTSSVPKVFPMRDARLKCPGPDSAITISALRHK